jgi:hypothetical protein
MLDINTLKAGDWITRTHESNIAVQKGEMYKVFNNSDGFYIIDDEGDRNYSLSDHLEKWELYKQDVVQKTAIKHLPILLCYLEQHSIVAWFNYDKAVIVCEAVYYDTVKKESFTVLEEVETNMKAVRDWLGY